VNGSGRYTYRAFVDQVDAALERHWRPIARVNPAWLPLPPCDALPAFRDGYRKNFEPPAWKRAWQALPGFVKIAVNPARLRHIWSAFPSPLRSFARPLVAWLRALLKPAH
jgi:hypothetical protein